MSELLVNTIKKADGTGSLSVPAESGTVVTTASPSVGRRNILINSAFQVSQRGDFTSASSSTNGAYFVDRWLSAQDVITANKQHLHNQTITSDITAHTLKIIATSSGTGNFQLSQPIERVNQELGNKTLTYSVWVKTNNSNVRLRGIFDDSGWTQFDAVHTGDGTWQKLSTTFTTGPTRSAGHYQVQVLAFNNGNVSITSGDYIEIAQPQLEIGSVATPFEHRSYGEELALCQRYYYQWNTNEQFNAIAVGMAEQSNELRWVIPFHTEMRAKPSQSLSAAGDFTAWDASHSSDLNTRLAYYAGKNSAFIRYSANTSGFTIGRALVLYAASNANAAMKFDAEL